MPATIRTVGIKPEMQQQVTVELQVSTPSGGRHTFPMRIPDQGSAGANEDEARRHLKVFCQEALEAL